MTSPCGMDCFNCPAYLANDDMNIRTEIASKLKLPLEAATCEGCRNAQGTILFLGDNRPCSIFKCTKEKEINYCFDCPDFPCDHLHPYADKAIERPHNTKIFNLCLIKKMGVDRWAEDKALKVRQTYFNGILSVHAADRKE
jgi:hypothetical protein